MLNECLGMQKKKQRFDTGEVENLLENKTSMKTPADVLMNKELGVILENAVGRLPERYRVVFVLREIEEMSVQETGAVLSINESNVKVRLNRAKSMLRKNLEGHYKEQVYTFHLTRCDRIVNTVLARLGIA
jgi:RNA polymerase sigma-70 factor (ECF subfamily)